MRYKCLDCGRKLPTIPNTKCFLCRCGIDPKIVKAMDLKERQLDLYGRRKSIFH